MLHGSSARPERSRVAAIGLNRAEVMFREGKYPEKPVFPSRIGYEASGTIDAVGAGVAGFAVGGLQWLSFS